MLETGSKVGTSTRSDGGKHALVPVELIVSGAPEGAQVRFYRYRFSATGDLGYSGIRGAQG
jgi:hypothetical protein